MTSGKMKTGFSGKRVPGVPKSVLSKKNNVIMHLMYLDNRSTMRVNKTMAAMTPTWVTLNLMSHVPLRRKVRTGRGRRNITLLSQE